MPVYAYVNDAGDVIEEIHRIGKAPKRVTRKGVKYVRAIAVEHSGFKDTPGNYPMRTDVEGVHPSQAKELSDYLAEKGVPTQVYSDGTVRWESRGHRREYLKARGMIDRDAGYSD